MLISTWTQVLLLFFSDLFVLLKSMRASMEAKTHRLANIIHTSKGVNYEPFFS